MDPNNLATMRRTIIKSKYLSEMEIDEIKFKVQSKLVNQLPNVEANNNSSLFVCHLKGIRGNINHQKSLRTKMLPFNRNSTSILTGKSRQIDMAVKNHNDKTCFSFICLCLVIPMYHSKSLKN